MQEWATAFPEFPQVLRYPKSDIVEECVHFGVVLLDKGVGESTIGSMTPSANRTPMLTALAYPSKRSGGSV